MAITLDSMVFQSTLSQPPRVSNTVQADQATGALDLATNRIGQQISATNVQLSAFGQIKSSFVDIQSSGKSLSGLGKSSTAEDTTKAVQDFAAAFNKTSQAVNASVQGDSKAAGALASDARATLANIDLKKIVNNGNNTAELAKIGVNVNQDGTLAVDTQKLSNAIQTDANAVRDTLNKIGQQSEQAATRQLANNGNIGGAVNALSSRVQQLESTATDQQRLIAATQQNVEMQLSNLGRNAAGGVAAYMQMFSL
jgi:flagellar hook-associated protein 2